MEPLIVTAHTPAGFASNDPWSPALDGILAYWRLREVLGEEQFTARGASGQYVTCEDLPLDRDRDADGHWWWVCSSPRYVEHGTHDRYYHRRFDIDLATRFVAGEGSRKLELSAGPLKNYRNRLRIHITGSVVWHCVGDAAEIERLLRRCRTIGAGLAQGVGRVMRWDVQPGGDERLARTARPLPVEHARALGLTGPELDWGLVPPGRVHRVRCVMPEPGYG